MKDLKPLLRDDATEFERQLLNAALHDRPSPQLQARMRQGIGLTGPTLWAGNAKALLSALASKSGLMWTAAAVVVAGGVAAGVRYQSAGYPGAGSQSAPVSAEAASIETPAQEASAPAAEAAQAQAQASAPSTLGTSPNEAQPSALQAAENALGAARENAERVTAPAAGVSSAASGSSPSKTANAGSDTGQLREEIRLLDRARGALARGNSGEARAALEAYQQRFPDGILTREAHLLDAEVHAPAAAREHASHDNPKPRSTRVPR